LRSTRAIETRSLPSSLAATHRGFAFYIALPKKLHSLDRDLWQQEAVRALQQGKDVVVQAPTAWPTMHHKPLMIDQVHYAS
jgi:superfamily II RNA helicase